jgi:hypothetical protein
MEQAPREKQRIFPAPPARIKDLAGGIYDVSEKELQTIYGKIKRVMLVAVIVKRDFTAATETEDGKARKNRINLVLEDGTSSIKATWFGVDEDNAKEYEVGDIVKIVAKVSEYQNEINLLIDGMKKISDFNDELYQRAKILEKLSSIARAGSKLVMENGGRVTNRPDEVSQFFSSKTKIDADINDIEKPLNVKESDHEGLQFQSKIGKETGASKQKGSKKMTEVVATNDTDTEQELGPDDDFIKDTIMETIMEPEYADGIKLNDLQEVTSLDRKVLARVLKIMENEGMIQKIGPDTYSEK